MTTISPALLDLGTARRIAQEHVGADMRVTACWQRPEGIYGPSSNETDGADDDNFYFEVLEAFPKRIGATRHIAVDRRTGAIAEIGRLGE
jgi:hypothetical protein